MPQGLKAKTGTYIVVLRSDRERRIAIGRVGVLTTEPGYYLYVGSAFGPGGVKARLGHHLNMSQRPHWHLDYLRRELEVVECWFSYDPEVREHQWAETLDSYPSSRRPLPGFGASDCRCPTHLYYFKRAPALAGFRRRLRARVAGHKPLHRFQP